MSQKVREYKKEICSKRDKLLTNGVLNDYNETREKILILFKEVEDEHFENNHLYQLEAEIIESLVKGSFVNVNSYIKNEKKLEIVAVAGFKEFVEAILKFSKIKLVGKQLLLEDKFAELSLLQGKLHKIPRGLKDAALKSFPDVLVDLLDEMFGPFFCYGAGLVYNKELVGNLAIIGRKVKIDTKKEEIVNNLLPIYALVEMIYKDLRGF